MRIKKNQMRMLVYFFVKIFAFGKWRRVHVEGK